MKKKEKSFCDIFVDVVKSFAKSSANKKAAEKFLGTAAGKCVGSNAYQVARGSVNVACTTEVGKKVIAKMASGISEKSLAGAASRTVVASALKGNAVTAGVGMAISSIGDTKNFLNGNISGKQFAKNLTSNAAGVGGGMAGWATGAAMGSAFGPVGTLVGGFVGCFFGSNGASKATKSLLD